MALGLVLVLGSARLVQGLATTPSPALRAIELAVGVAAIVVGVVLWRHRRVSSSGAASCAATPTSPSAWACS